MDIPLNWNPFQWRSLKLRVTLLTLAIFVISIWSLAFYASRMLHEDMQRMSGEQQFSSVTFMAAVVNGELKDRMSALELIASEITPAMMSNPVALQARLEQRPILQLLFNAGNVVFNAESKAIADFPVVAGRVGVTYKQLSVVRAALDEGKSSFGKPIVSKTTSRGNPIIGFGAPIRDDQGRVIGVVAGVTDLDKPNFFDKIVESRYGKTGGYLLNSLQYRLIITASDKGRVMQPLPAPGVNKMLDRYMQGYEGYGVSVNSRGIEEISAAKGIPVAGWFMGVVLPTAEAFSPIRDMQQRLLLAANFLTLLAGALTWWMLRRELAPMLATVKTLAQLSKSSLPPQALPIVGQDEISELIGGFNHLLATLGKQQEELEATLGRIKRLEGLLSICMQCKRIRTENNDWHQLEQYIGEHSDAVFSHGLCPDCLDKAMKKLD